MARLLHLNGPPGIGKSTLARGYAEERPGEIVRPATLALLVAHLTSGRDVVVPQMVALLGGRAGAQRSGAPGQVWEAAPNVRPRSDASVSRPIARRRSSPSVEATSNE